MRTKEALAIVGTCAALGGAIGAGGESKERANAASNVVVAEACRDTYGNDESYIGKKVLECMRKGWVPHAGRADDGDFDSESPREMQGNYPDGLLEGYIEGQQARAGRVELDEPAVDALIGAAVGLMIAGISGAGDGRRSESVSRDGGDGPKAAAPPEPSTPPSDR